MYLAYMIKSDKPEKKYKVIVSDGNTLKTIYFGSSMYEDYTTMHKNDTRRERTSMPSPACETALCCRVRKKLYIDRHKSKEDWNNPFTAGFWSRWILWNKKTILASIKDTEKRFKMEIYYKK